MYQQSCTKTRYADLANIGGGREAGTIHAAIDQCEGNNKK